MNELFLDLNTDKSTRQELIENRLTELNFKPEIKSNNRVDYLVNLRQIKKSLKKSTKPHNMLDKIQNAYNQDVVKFFNIIDENFDEINFAINETFEIDYNLLHINKMINILQKQYQILNEQKLQEQIKKSYNIRVIIEEQINQISLNIPDQYISFVKKYFQELNQINLEIIKELKYQLVKVQSKKNTMSIDTFKISNEISQILLNLCSTKLLIKHGDIQDFNYCIKFVQQNIQKLILEQKYHDTESHNILNEETLKNTMLLLKNNFNKTYNDSLNILISTIQKTDGIYLNFSIKFHNFVISNFLNSYSEFIYDKIVIQITNHFNLDYLDQYLEILFEQINQEQFYLIINHQLIDIMQKIAELASGGQVNKHLILLNHILLNLKQNKVLNQEDEIKIDSINHAIEILNFKQDNNSIR